MRNTTYSIPNNRTASKSTKSLWKSIGAGTAIAILFVFIGIYGKVVVWTDDQSLVVQKRVWPWQTGEVHTFPKSSIEMIAVVPNKYEAYSRTGPYHADGVSIHFVQGKDFEFPVPGSPGMELQDTFDAYNFARDLTKGVSENGFHCTIWVQRKLCLIIASIVFGFTIALNLMRHFDMKLGAKGTLNR